MAGVGKLLWAQTSYYVVVTWIVRKRCLRVSPTMRLCVHCKTLSYIASPFPVPPTLTSDNSFVLFAAMCAWGYLLSLDSWSWAFCFYWPNSYCYNYWLCGVQLTTLLSRCLHKSVDHLLCDMMWAAQVWLIACESQVACLDSIPLSAFFHMCWVSV